MPCPSHSPCYVIQIIVYVVNSERNEAPQCVIFLRDSVTSSRYVRPRPSLSTLLAANAFSLFLFLEVNKLASLGYHYITTGHMKINITRKKIGEMYSLECNDISKAFFTTRHEVIVALVLS